MDCSVVIRPDDFRQGETIMLKFTMADTEELYDEIFIYAPESSTVPLETVSGASFATMEVRTKEPSMRVRFVSDGGTTAEGFEAFFRVEYAPPPTPPPSCVAETTCNGNGYCDGDVCKCFDGFAGASCSQETACPERVRRSWYDLHVGERKWFQDAVWELKTRGLYDVFPRVHNSNNNNPYAHGNSGFLPWHRLFLWEFEEAIRELGGRYKCFTLAYWAWELDAGLPDQREAEFWKPTPVGWGGGYGQCVRDPYFKSWVATDGFCLTRAFTNTPLIGESQVVYSITSFPTYGTDRGFREELEGNLHSMPHLFVDGHMLAFNSPNDPIFFLHHANVDRLWALWQDCHDHDQVPADRIRTSTYTTTGNGALGGHLDRPMPYSLENGEDNGRFKNIRATPRDMHSIKSSRMTYSYAEDDGLASLSTLKAGCQTLHWFKTSKRGMATLGGRRNRRPSQFPHVASVRSFIESLHHAPSVEDVKTAAKIECQTERPKPMPQSWIDMMLGKGKKPSDFPFVCDN